MTDDMPDLATRPEVLLPQLRRFAVRRSRELGLNATDRAAFVLGSVLGEQARTAGIHVPADALGHLREDG